MSRTMNRVRMALLGASVCLGGSGAALAYDIAAEIGRPVSSLDAKSAEVVLNWYAEGKVLAFAPKAPRVELLEAVVKALPKDGKTHQRAALLLVSAQTSTWSAK